MKHTIGKITSNIFVTCGRSDVTPTMATKSVTVDMTLKW
jgi:hypothetical protein